MLDTVSTHTKAYPPEQQHEEPPHVQLTFDLLVVGCNEG